MFRSATAAVLATLLAGAPAGASMLPGIIDGDDRVALESDVWPWSAIGRVNKDGLGFCTGTLIDTGLVATAAHCLINPRTGRLHRPDYLTFVAGYSRGDYRAVSRVERYEFPACTGDEPVDGLSSIAHDVVFLRLAEEMIDPAPVRLVAPHEQADDGELVLAGYQQDRPHMLSAHSGCRAIRWLAEDKVLIHSCDATRGASGGPILQETAGGWRVVALHVGTGRTDGEAGRSVGLASTWPVGTALAGSLTPEPGSCGPDGLSAGGALSPDGVGTR